MTIGCNIWMICLKLKIFFYGLSRMLHLSEFVWILRSSILVVFNNFLLIDAADRSKIRSDQKSFFIALSLYPLSFFANTPFKWSFNDLEIIHPLDVLSKFLFRGPFLRGLKIFRITLKTTPLEGNTFLWIWKYIKRKRWSLWKKKKRKIGIKKIRNLSAVFF